MLLFCSRVGKGVAAYKKEKSGIVMGCESTSGGTMKAAVGLALGMHRSTFFHCRSDSDTYI